MAKEEVKEIAQEKAVETKSFKVTKSFTLDKFYNRGSVFVSNNKEIIEKLINNKNIK